MESTAGRALNELYDVAMLDLDGVVNIGGEAVPGAPELLAQARESGQRLAFVTNNAARTPEVVADHLTAIGVPAHPHDVVTSAQAAARVLAASLPTGALVATLGADGLRTALAAEGLVAVEVDHPGAQALVNGYAPNAAWHEIMRAAVRVKDGLWWVATNTDMTIPTAYGTAPGNGVLVDLIRRFSGVEPVVAGKPDQPLLAETIRRVNAQRALMVGDRLDTDIAAGPRAGVDTLLVLTGVTGLAELVAAEPQERPTYLAPTLEGLLSAHPVIEISGASAACGGWTATALEDGTLSVSGAGTVPDWWRAVAAAGWRWLDQTGSPAAVDALTVPSGR